MRTIWKFPFAVADTVEIPMPIGAQILHVDVQAKGAFLETHVWALVDSDAMLETRTLKVRGTGRPVEDRLRHLATFQHGPFVWHVFEDEK